MKPRLVRLLEPAQVQPYGVVTLVPNPGRRYEAGKRILETLKGMTPGSDQSFLVASAETAHYVAKREGMEVATKREGAKVRVWRIA